MPNQKQEKNWENFLSEKKENKKEIYKETKIDKSRYYSWT